MINKKEKGNRGEEIASQFLRKNGFVIANRNYYKKWGELDIVAKKGNELHFFEVKSVTRHFVSKSFRPEENVTLFKVKQLRKIIQTYLTDKGFGLDTVFQFHILCVFMNESTRLARVQWIKNVIL
ncbi:MAG: YraN family protein [Candidatus Pacebacteria bacterium]|nr:YraN family protein [Candidatus Paceibacterota bacterium]